MIEKPFWEKAYTKKGTPNTFNSGNPSWDVVEVIEKYLNGGNVLDLGCGDGRNAIYAASKGYNVTAIDISKNGVMKTKELAKAARLKIDAKVQNMRNFQSVKKFDLIISHGCLHLISRKEWPSVIKTIKNATIYGGYNIILVFTDKISPSDDMKPFMKGLFREGELFKIYNDWDLIKKSSHILEDEHEEGIKHRHAVNRIIAQKK
jgi:tellurite methyltransferase